MREITKTSVFPCESDGFGAEAQKSMQFRSGTTTLRDPRRATDHLDALAQAHNELLEALACKREAIRETIPDPIAICRARWNVGRANRYHRIVVDRILRDLEIDADTDDLEVISQLRQSGIQQMQQSTRHIQDWTANLIMSRWQDFCAESAKIQADLQQRIRNERQSIEQILTRRT